MCLAVPARIECLIEDEVAGAMAEVDFGGALRRVSVAYVPEAQVGDYVIVHAGCALSVLSPDEAAEVLAEWAAGGCHDDAIY